MTALAPVIEPASPDLKKRPGHALTTLEKPVIEAQATEISDADRGGDDAHKDGERR
jgi:hypothetical protein